MNETRNDWKVLECNGTKFSTYTRLIRCVECLLKKKKCVECDNIHETQKAYMSELRNSVSSKEFLRNVGEIKVSVFICRHNSFIVEPSVINIKMLKWFAFEG